MRVLALAITLASAGLLLSSSGCLRDFDQFEVSEDGVNSGGSAGESNNSGLAGEKGSTTDGGSSSGGAQGGGGQNSTMGTGATDSGGGPADGGAPGSGAGDSGGSGGSGGNDDGCGSGLKLCSSECVLESDPATGCAEEGCSPCPTPSNATVGCDAGRCAVVSCDAGLFDCDDSAGNGCEHSQSTYDEQACGGCDADCTSLGLTDCQSGRCGCTQDAECKGNANKDYSCGNRLCSCGGTACNVGETCRRFGSSAECSCGDGSACDDGWVCCPGGGGPSCKQLDGSDASNCGACGVQCAGGEVCVSGVCQAAL